MVASNPLFVGGHFYRKFKATVVNDIWPEVLFFTLVATSAYWLSPVGLLSANRVSLRSGNVGVGNDNYVFGGLKPDADRSRYSARFGHIVPDFHGL